MLQRGNGSNIFSPRSFLCSAAILCARITFVRCCDEVVDVDVLVLVVDVVEVVDNVDELVDVPK